MTPGQPPSLTSPRKISNGLGNRNFLESTDPRVTESPKAKYWRTQRIHFSKKKILTTLAKSFRPPRPIRVSRGRPIIGGWRVGRNPLSVRSSICLIGEPAPQAELIGVYIPFHSAMGTRFIPRPALHPGRPGEHPIIVTRYRDGYRFCAPTQALARHVTCYASALWVEFPQNNAVLSTLFCDCSPTRHPNRKTRDL